VGGSGSHPESGRSKMSDSGTSRQIAAAQYFGRFWSEADIQRVASGSAAYVACPLSEITARVAVSAIRETLAERASLGFTREQIRHHFHAAPKERAKWPHRHEAYDEHNQYKAKHPSNKEEARRVLVHEQSWYCRNYREESIANPIEHLLDPVEAKVFAATISASTSGWGEYEQRSHLRTGCCAAVHESGHGTSRRFVVTHRFGRYWR
jgi:hypothetical protein